MHLKFLLLWACCLPVLALCLALDSIQSEWRKLISNLGLPSNTNSNDNTSSETSSAAEDRRGAVLLQELGITRTTPRPFYIRPDRISDVLLASIPIVTRLGSGAFADGYQFSLIPKSSSEYTIWSWRDYQLKETCKNGRTSQLEPLILYESENCSFCRVIREAISMLSLTVTYRPCPPRGVTFRRTLTSTTTADNLLLPVMYDPNTGVTLRRTPHTSAMTTTTSTIKDLSDFMEYLFRTYGNGSIPPLLQPSSSLLPWISWDMGRCRTANPATIPLTLWTYEGSPFGKLVRNRLVEYELEHTQISCPRGSPNRQRMFAKTGRFQVPYLEDPNTGVKLWESEAIIQYLDALYGIKDSPVKYM